MSITEATANLDTSYTERDTVLFNAGTLASISECVTEVESKLKRGILTASSTPSVSQVQRWLIRAKQELAEIKNFTWRRRYVYATTTAGTWRYALPPDFNGGFVRIRDTTNERYINIYEPGEFEQIYSNLDKTTNDVPLFACVKNMELWLAPPPNAAYTLEFEYDRTGADNIATDFSWLPEIERFRCCDFAVAEAFESIHMWDVSDRFRNKWGSGIGKAIRADGKRKWRSMSFRARSFLERPIFDKPASTTEGTGDGLTIGGDDLTF